MAVTRTGVTLPRFYSAVPLEPATAQDHTSLSSLCPSCAPAQHILLLLLLPHLLLLRGRHLGAARRMQLWPRSQGCPGGWHFSKPRDTSSSDYTFMNRKCSPGGFSHAQSSVPTARNPVPAEHLESDAHLHLWVSPVPAPPPSYPQVPGRTPVPSTISTSSMTSSASIWCSRTIPTSSLSTRATPPFTASTT